MKKIYFALMCMASFTLMTACGGDKKSDSKDVDNDDQEELVQNDEDADDGFVSDEGMDQNVNDEGADPALAAPVDLTTLYATGDFKPAANVLFLDSVGDEKVSEFPSKWDLKDGSAEVVQIGQRKVIQLSGGDATIAPVINGGSNDYLPETFTVEFEYYCNGENMGAYYYLQFFNENDDHIGELFLNTRNDLSWWFDKTNDERVDGNAGIDNIEKKNAWNHLAISYDKGSVKAFINGKRVANMPGVVALKNFKIHAWPADNDNRYLFTNIRVTTGA